MPEIKPDIETFAKIKVVGVGGGGGKAVNRMIDAKIKGVEFIAINTDVQDLHQNQSKKKLQIGAATTRGLGAGMNPEVGLQSAQESVNEIRDILKGADMIFLTGGLGGGTASGSLPAIASVAKEQGALVVAIVTKPFAFEGAQRNRIADSAHKELSDRVDTIITIPNEKILQIVDKKTPILDAFQTVDDVLRQGIQGISELITVPGLINVDFADVKAIMQDAGSALMGIGEVSGDGRATAAAKKAIASPLLDLSIDGAKGILFTITGGQSLTMDEVNEAAEIITESADSDAKIIFGAVIDDNLKDRVRISVVATGFGDSAPRGNTDESKYSSSRLFTNKKIDDRFEMKKDEPKKRFFTPKEEKVVDESESESPVRPQLRPTPIMDSEEEDLEIPAFIRKKMK